MNKPKNLLKVDHVTYACTQGNIEKWAWFHIEVEGGKLIKRIDDIDPDNPNSSMKLWCISYDTFGIALIEGIDRLEKSQVTVFCDRHGDHSIQHVAYEVSNLDGFIEQLEQYECHTLSEPILTKDNLGIIKQVFCRGYSQLPVTESTFAEYLERPNNNNNEMKITFSQKVGKGFFNQIQESVKAVTFTNFSKMPVGWNPPVVEDSI